MYAIKAAAQSDLRKLTLFDGAEVHEWSRQPDFSTNDLRVRAGRMRGSL